MLQCNARSKKYVEPLIKTESSWECTIRKKTGCEAVMREGNCAMRPWRGKSWVFGTVIGEWKQLVILGWEKNVVRM